MNILDKVCELYPFDIESDNLIQQETVKVHYPNIKIDISEMAKKFQTRESYEIFLKLCQFMQDINQFDARNYQKWQEIYQYKKDNNLPTHQIIPMDTELSELVAKEYNELLDKYATDNLIRYSGRISNPRYDYINKGCIAKIIMKSNRKIMVEFAFLNNDILFKYSQFTLKSVNNEWLIDKFRYRFDITDNWQTKSI